MSTASAGPGPAPPVPPAPAAPPADATPVAMIAALALAAGASGISLRLADPLLPRLAAEFGTTLGGASWVVTCFAVAYGLSQLLFGPLGDRFGKLRVIGWACAASAATALACALAPGFGALLLARLLAGASCAAVIPLAMAWIGDAVPYERRQPVLARFLIGQITGFASGVWLGGFAAEHLPWRAPFVLVALLFVVVSLVLLAARRRAGAAAPADGPAALPAATAPAPAAVAGPPSPSVAGLGPVFTPFAAVLGERWARRVLTTVAAEGALVYGPFAFIAAHLHQRHGLSLATVGLLVMGFALGGLGFALGARALVARLGERGLVRGGAALIAAALATLALAPAWGWAVPACIAMGLGFYMLHNTLQTHATQMAPACRGTAVAAFACCFFLGQSAGVALAGRVVDAAGTRPVLLAGALGVLALGVVFARLLVRRARG